MLVLLNNAESVYESCPDFPSLFFHVIGNTTGRNHVNVLLSENYKQMNTN